jgi:PAS domain S-box-containing protein
MQDVAWQRSGAMRATTKTIAALVVVTLAIAALMEWSDVYRRFGERAGTAAFALAIIAIMSFIIWWNSRSLHRAQLELRDTANRLQLLVDASPLPIIVIDEDSRVRMWSPAAERVFGWTADETLGEIIPIVPKDQVSRVRATRPDRQYGVERRRLRKDGTLIDLNLWSVPLRDETDRVIGTLGVFADVTERKKLESRLRQSQKLDALGTLAGGIAHDFNNILTALGLNLAMAQADLPANHPVQRNLSQMDAAFKRASNLTRQILTFGRQQEQSRELITLTPVVTEALNLLRATLPAGIEIRTTLARDLPTVLADATQIHQIIMNLGINAAHAISGQSGVIEVKLEDVAVDAAMAVSAPELHPGRYVRLTMSDTGRGMDPATVDRIFEPFFTTKPSGQGTGLGLSVVRGIVKNHDGAITVYSQPNKGTRFHVYFPAMELEAIERKSVSAAEYRGNGERILYLDDEEPIVSLVTVMLKRLGYEVEGFKDVDTAIAAFTARPEAFDLVVSDLSMPGGSGIDFATDVLKIRPDVPVLIATGYIDPDTADVARECGVRDVILKPASVEELGVAIRRVLEGAPAS